MTIPGTAVILPGMTTTGFALPADLAYEEWCATGHALARVGRAIQWAIGDWLNFGEAAYGERYAQAISELGLDYQTVSNYAWVARTFPASSREEKLTFRHHLDAAGVANPAQRAELLLRAVTEGWSTRQVRMEANAIKALAKLKPTVDPLPANEHNITKLCECLQPVLDGLQPDDFTSDDPMWLRWLIAKGLDAKGVRAP